MCKRRPVDNAGDGWPVASFHASTGGDIACWKEHKGQWVKTRREILKMVAAAGGSAMLPAVVQRALAIPARRRTGTIQDVEHVVVLMQENRSFDHYFGSLRGVRGFNDPRPAPLPNGQSVWQQPTATVKTARYRDRGLSPRAAHVLPFYLDPQRTTEHQSGTDHGWSSGHLAWNQGRHDQWINQKQDVLTMGYLVRDDLKLHYALADAFTLCDSYFCSVFADTCPNRIYLWTGTIDPQNKLGAMRNGPGLEERSGTNGYSWTTYPERLQKAGISWKVYQGGTGIPGSPTDNYTDNSLEFFRQYQVGEGASPDSELVRRGVSTHTLRDLQSDVIAGKLPQVSWIVAPYEYCEHPKASPGNGAYYISLVLEALMSDPEVWASTVLLLNYDENDGLFDHVPPPIPPRSSTPGHEGMVSAELVESLRDEFIDRSRYPEHLHPLVPGAETGGMQPIGLGPRVPMLAISPWSTGGWVCSEVFDHTSVLRLLERRFGVEEPNISRWRRSICGDLTSAFDFAVTAQKASVAIPRLLPVASLHEQYAIPFPQKMPAQEPGTRPARPLPYVLETHCRVKADGVWIELINRGSAGASFYVYDRIRHHLPPRRYTVSAGDSLTDCWAAREGEEYHLAVYGPNGYVAEQRGELGISVPRVTATYAQFPKRVKIGIENPRPGPLAFSVKELYTSFTEPFLPVGGGEEKTIAVTVDSASGWFDLAIRAEALPRYHRRFAGHIEDGHPSIGDPGPPAFYS